jgi:3-ketosteroid 9alpha-monooxygenase subunit A
VAARTRSWRTLERNGQLFVWHDAEGNPPPDDVVIPAIEGAGSPEWTDWTWDSILVEGANCREVIDNVVDMAHFFYVHFAFPTFFKNVFEGHVATQYLNTRSRPDIGGVSNYTANSATDSTTGGSGIETSLRSEASYYGPSYMIDYLWQDYHGMTMESVLINCHYPVSPTSFLLQWGAIVKKPAGLSDGQAARVAVKFADFVGLGFQQDVAIWMNKARIDNPLLCAEDGPVYQVRRWYEQFYRDVADIEPDMTARFEFEIDTARAVAGWEAEVAENLARASGGSGGVVPPTEAQRSDAG